MSKKGAASGTQQKLEHNVLQAAPSFPSHHCAPVSGEGRGVKVVRESVSDTFNSDTLLG